MVLAFGVCTNREKARLPANIATSIKGRMAETGVAKEGAATAIRSGITTVVKSDVEKDVDAVE